MIAISSDHLALRNSLTDRLATRNGTRKLLFSIFDGSSTSVEKRMSHFDVVPTLLDVAGFSSDIRIGYGESAYYQSALDLEPKGADINSPMSDIFPAENIFFLGLSIDNKSNVVRIGDTEIQLVTSAGKRMQEGVLFIMISEDGAVFDVVADVAPAVLSAELDGMFAVTVQRTDRGEKINAYIPNLSAENVFDGRVFSVEKQLALSPETLRDIAFESGR